MPTESGMGESSNPIETSNETPEMRSKTLNDAREGTGAFTVDPERTYSVAPDMEDGMAEAAAALEIQQKAEIERVASEASGIGPDFENGVRTELQGTARETLRMKIESKIYDVLTAIEKGVGQMEVTRRMKESMAREMSMGRDTARGLFENAWWDSNGVKHEGVPRSTAQETFNDVALGKRNLRNGSESAVFVPSGQEIPSSLGFSNHLVAEKPTVDWDIRSVTGHERFSHSVADGTMVAQEGVEYNPLIQKLEQWRANLKARRENTREAAQLVTAYRGVTVSAGA